MSLIKWFENDVKEENFHKYSTFLFHILHVRIRLSICTFFIDATIIWKLNKKTFLKGEKRRGLICYRERGRTRTMLTLIELERRKVECNEDSIKTVGIRGDKQSHILITRAFLITATFLIALITPVNNQH